MPKKQARPPNSAVIDNNIILANDVKMSLNTRQHGLNLNCLIVGGSGTGKTRYYLLPNLLNANTSYVITDPKGEILRSTGTFLKKMGYDIKVFNLIDMRNSSNYNPFNYVYDDKGRVEPNYVKKMIKVLMKNVGGKDSGGKDPFWDDMAEKLISAISFYLLEEGRKSERNFAKVADIMRLIELSEPKKGEEEKKSEIDIMFEKLAEVNPQSQAVLNYREFQQGGKGKMAQSIVAVANSKLQSFNLPSVSNLTFTDTLGLETIGDRKTAMFIIIPASDTTFNFLAAIMYTQMFDILYNRANFKYSGRLPVHVRFLLDEFANVGQIPDFQSLISTMRSMEISVNVILQAISQLKELYEKSWETIVGNCNSYVFLGSPEMSTLEDMSKRLGKETIDVQGKNRTKGKQSSTSENNSILGRELLTPDEIGKLDNKYTIVVARGQNPFISEKYKLERHPNYIYTEQYDPKNAFDYSSVKTLLAPKKRSKDEQKKQNAELHKAEFTGEQTNKKLDENSVNIEQVLPFWKGDTLKFDGKISAETLAELGIGGDFNAKNIKSGEVSPEHLDGFSDDYSSDYSGYEQNSDSVITNVTTDLPQSGEDLTEADITGLLDTNPL
ncbi:conjugal transfer protein TraG [Clostridia bacterium]|nr:conjugal transfer protein TraG [Clostridia bacterium]